MGTFVIEEAMGDYQNLLTTLDLGTLVPIQANTDSLVLADASGDTLTFYGTGLEYEGTLPAVSVLTGRITGMTATNSAAEQLLTVSDIDVSATSLYNQYLTFGLLAAYYMITNGNDTFQGSSNADVIMSGGGNDKIKGGGGEDYIEGSAGRDKLWGGGDFDTFYFDAESGKDTINDFTDADRRSDDMIAVARSMYRKMVVTEDAGGVLLDFGKTEVYVKGWTEAQVDQGDFLVFG